MADQEDVREGPVLTVFCKDKEAQLYLGSLARLTEKTKIASNGRQAIRGPCLLYNGEWISLNQFVVEIYGKDARPPWKKVIKHNRVPMGTLLDQGIMVLDERACYCDGCTGKQKPSLVTVKNNLPVNRDPRQKTLHFSGAARHANSPRPSGSAQHRDLTSPRPGPSGKVNSTITVKRLEEPLEEGGWLSTRKRSRQSSTQGEQPNQYGDAGKDARPPDTNKTLIKKKGTKRPLLEQGEDLAVKPNVRQMLLSELPGVVVSQQLAKAPSGTIEDECIEISDDENDRENSPSESYHDDELMEIENLPETAIQMSPQKDSEEDILEVEVNCQDEPKTSLNKTLIHFGLTREEERSLEADDVDIYDAGDLVMPGDDGEEEEMSRYQTLLKDLCEQNYQQFLQHLVRKRPVPADNNVTSDRSSVIKAIKHLQMKDQTSQVAGEPRHIAELVKGKLVLCIDNRIDGQGSMRLQLSEKRKEVMAATEDSQPVDEDRFRMEEDELERRRRKQPDAEKPAYRDSQTFLAEILKERIKLIQEQHLGIKMEEQYDDFYFQIYTPRAKMLESQTKTRAMAADAECFAPEVYKSQKTLFETAEKCVQILLTRTGHQKQTKAEKRHRELLAKAKGSPRTFFLIIADEAHWGPTSEASPDDNTDGDEEDNGTPSTHKVKQTSRAYSNLVNKWTDEDYPNVFVLLVSATPYNLLTKNTRLDLTKMCVTDVIDGKRQLRLATESDATTKQVRLHHMKWEELIDYDIQHGVCNVLMIPLKNSNRFLHVDEDGTIQAGRKENNKFTEVEFKGPSSNEVQIQIIRNGKEESLVVCEDLSKKRKEPEVKFLPRDVLSQYDARLHTFKVTLHGMDVFHLETSDGKYLINRKEDGDSENEHVTKFCASTKSVDTSISRKDCFFVYKKQPQNTLEPIDEYTSLNFYFNSLAEEKDFDAYLRNDSLFDEMANHILQQDDAPSTWNMYDILTAEYAIHMVHVFEIRECKLVEDDLSLVLSTMHSACGEYTEKRDKLILQLEEELQQKSKIRDKNFSWIDPDLFRTVLHHLEERTKESLRKSLKRFLLPEDKDKDEDIDVCSYLVECLLFLRKSTLDCFQKEIAETLYSDERYSDVFMRFSRFDFEKQKMVRVKENETCRLIDDLVLAKDDKPLHGSMKIVRMTTKSGNKMYATLCLARKIASPKTHFTFEIVRDFDKFEIKHVQKKPDSSCYRIHQVLQCRDCTHVDKTTFERCTCIDRGRFGPDLKCIECGHIHTTVKDYVDLKDLPCLVILVGKGRMGDTFPDNFNAMDLRVSTRDLKQPTLTPLVQEFGRLCCYGKKDDPGKIPYMLLGKELAKTLVRKRKNHATLFGGFDDKHKDAYIEAGNKARETHADYQNTYKHKNRILLEAEPQIGKTGVYLCLVSLLRKMIEGQEEEEQEEFEEIVEEDDEADIAPKETEAADWVRPFWQDMKKEPVLKKELPTGKYVSLFGPYVFGNRPEKIVGGKNTPTNHRKSVPCRGVPTKFRTFSKNAPLTSTRSDARCTRKDYFMRVHGVKSKISVPTQQRFCPLFLKLDLDKELLQRSKRRQEQRMYKDQQKLETWIFTPSYGRCRRAYLNYDQTMLDSNGRPVQYVHVIVVRPAEYDAYVREWGFSHAVICLPPSLPGIDVGPEEGGVGYARLFIQLLAQEYGLPAVVMLDDNIHYVRQIETRIQDGKHVVAEDDGKHSFVSAPLFACLKNLELQLYGEHLNPPKDTGTFDPYPHDSVPHGTQESFTGPWAKYGIIGILRDSKFIYTYKYPFRRTHVTAVTLVNIRALTEKNLTYKPWQVWEDLHMNNQCDNAGLWVVKYNKYAVRKVNISNWLPKYFTWTDTTEISKEPAPAKKTNCLLTLKKYLCHCGPMKKMETVVSKKTAVCEDMRQLTTTLSTQKDGHHLVVVNDEETTITNIQAAVGKAFSDGDGKVVLVLPSRVCLNYNLTTKSAFQMMLAEHIDSAFKFDCISSEDVSKQPVALVLVHIQVPLDGAQSAMKGKAVKRRQTDQKVVQGNEVMDLETEEIQDNVPTSTTKAAFVQQNDPRDQGNTTVTNREREGGFTVQSQLPSNSVNSQRNTKAVIAQQNGEDPGERRTWTLPNEERKESTVVQSQDSSTSGDSQGVKQCQKCDTKIQNIKDRNRMENDSSIKEVLDEQAVDTPYVLLCDTCVDLIMESRRKLKDDLRKHRDACRIKREVSNISLSPKSSMRKNRLSLSGRRDAASAITKPGNAGVRPAASGTPALPQQMQVPRVRTSTVRRPLPYGNHLQQAEPSTPTNVDSILWEIDAALQEDLLIEDI